MVVLVRERDYFYKWFQRAFSNENYEGLRERMDKVLAFKPKSDPFEFNEDDFAPDDLKLLAMFVSLLDSRSAREWEEKWGRNPLGFPPTACFMWATDPNLRVDYWKRYNKTEGLPDCDLLRADYVIERDGVAWCPALDVSKPFVAMRLECFGSEIYLPVGVKAEEVEAYQKVVAEHGHPTVEDFTTWELITE